ncbi:MAG: sortase [Caldilineaceae bacterium]|nr:sortase [Caldilineaceae bacterium]
MSKKLMLIGSFCLVVGLTFVQAQFSFAAADQKVVASAFAAAGGPDVRVVKQQSPLPTPTNTPIPAPTSLPPTGADLTGQWENHSSERDIALSGSIATAAENTQAANNAMIYPVHLAVAAIKLDTEVKPLGWRQVIEGNQDVSVWQVVDNAAGWHLNSAVPGEVGNVVISGHNNIGGSVFRNLHRLEAGDEITLLTNTGTELVYVVDNVQIVKEKYASAAQREANAAAISQTSDKRLTLITCWPSYSNTHRVIVVAHPVE